MSNLVDVNFEGEAKELIKLLGCGNLEVTNDNPGCCFVTVAAHHKYFHNDCILAFVFNSNRTVRIIQHRETSETLHVIKSTKSSHEMVNEYSIEKAANLAIERFIFIL